MKWLARFFGAVVLFTATSEYARHIYGLYHFVPLWMLYPMAGVAIIGSVLTYHNWWIEFAREDREQWELSTPALPPAPRNSASRRTRNGRRGTGGG